MHIQTTYLFPLLKIRSANVKYICMILKSLIVRKHILNNNSLVNFKKENNKGNNESFTIESKKIYKYSCQQILHIYNIIFLNVRSCYIFYHTV